MKFLVFSDSHSRNVNIKRAIDTHKAMFGIDCIFHLGDGHKDLELLAREIPVLSVDGNFEEYCSSYIEKKSLVREAIIELGGFKFFLTHGHTYNIKSSLDYAISEAVRQGADVLMFGHTHTRFYKYIPPSECCPKGLYVFNPGSISRPRDTYCSYGVIDTDGKNILLSHAILQWGIIWYIQ